LPLAVPIGRPDDLVSRRAKCQKEREHRSEGGKGPRLTEGSTKPRVAVHHADDARAPLPTIAGEGRAWAVIWPGMGAKCRSLHRISLASGGASMPLRHPGEAVYYVLTGGGAVEDTPGTARPLIEGSMVHVAPRAGYHFQAGDAGLELIGGPCPADPALYGGASPCSAPVEPNEPGPVRIFHRDDPGVQVPLISRDARLIVWLGVGAETANMNFVRLEPGEANVAHIHPESEDTIYILQGRGTVADFDHDLRLSFEGGDVIHVPTGIKHAVHADRGQAVVSVGGPAPADRHMLRAAGLLA
jgi:quercetin dioxygenase-like cupin family protein